MGVRSYVDALVLLADNVRGAERRECVAEVGLERLADGSVYAWVPFAGLHARWSRLRVRATTSASRKLFGADPAR